MTLWIPRQKAVGGLLGLAWLTVCALVFNAGCGALLHNQRHKDDVDFTVIPFSTYSALALSGDDVRFIMEKAGFTPPQIWALGLDVHNGLKELGGVKIRMGKKYIEAIFRVQGYHVWIQTRTRGLFVYDVKSKQFTVGPGAQSYPPGVGMPPGM